MMLTLILIVAVLAVACVVFVLSTSRQLDAALAATRNSAPPWERLVEDLGRRGYRTNWFEISRWTREEFEGAREAVAQPATRK